MKWRLKSIKPIVRPGLEMVLRLPGQRLRAVDFLDQSEPHNGLY